MTIGTAQLDAIARSLKAHGTGPENIARLAKLFHVSEESIASAVALAEAPSAWRLGRGENRVHGK